MRRSGFVAVIGAPNAGKSTLVNRLVGAKVSIVTPKVQTTRFCVRGVAIVGEAQLVLVDTPGIFAPRRRLDRAMVGAAWSGAREADVTLHVVDARPHARLAAGRAGAADRRGIAEDETIVGRLAAGPRTAVLALNKIDLVKPPELLPLAARLRDVGAYDAVFMISAASGDGVADLAHALAARMPEGEWLYPAGQHDDLPLAIAAAEATREKVFLRVHQELPYAAAVETTSLETQADGSLRIEQTILVERPGQRAIVIGHNGETLKWIGQAARVDLAARLGRPVHLFLHVKADPRWAERAHRYREVGLDPDA